MKCNTCRKEYSANCDYQQGRCPHHRPMINIQPKDTSKGHFYVSLIKSGIRIVAGGSLIAAGYAMPEGWLVAAGALLIGAEILGIVEELV